MKTFIKEKLFNKKGFTLVEIILIFGTLGILTAVIIPSLPDYKKTDESELCYDNREQMEESYEEFLTTVDTTQPQNLFSQYLKEYGEDICPEGGEITYCDGRVECNIHSIVTDSEGDEDVPYL